jgi:hypothetical protein
MGLHFLYVAVYKIHRDCAPSRTVIVLDEGKGIIRVAGRRGEQIKQEEIDKEIVRREMLKQKNKNDSNERKDT